MGDHLLAVDDHRAQHAHRIDAAMLVEILVLGGQEGVDHPLRHGADRHEGALLHRIFGDQAAVAGIDAGGDRRLVMGQLVIVRQIVAIVPEQAQHASRGDDGQKKQGADQHHQEFHRRRHIMSVAFSVA